MRYLRQGKKFAFILPLILGVNLVTPYFAKPAWAGNNRQEVRNTVNNEGWHIITIYRFDHWEYASWAAAFAAGYAPAKITNMLKSVKYYDQIKSFVGTAGTASKIYQVLDAVAQGQRKRIDGYTIEGKLLTYNHWRKELATECNFGICKHYHKVPEPNTYEWVILIKDTRRSSNPNRVIARQGSHLGDRIQSHREIHVNDYLLSGDGRFKAIMQGDGNFVIYQSGVGPIWATNTVNKGDKIAMQGDGNFVVYSDNRPTWASNTNGQGRGPYVLVMQNDGNLVVYDQTRAIWASNTCCR